MISYMLSETSSIPTRRPSSLSFVPNTVPSMLAMPTTLVAFPYTMFGERGTYPSVKTEQVNPDHMHTGKQGFMGDHHCDHYHVDGFICPVSSSFGPILDGSNEGFIDSPTMSRRRSILANTLVPHLSLVAKASPVLVPGVAGKQHAVRSEETLYKSGSDAEYGSRFKIQGTFAEIVPVVRKGEFLSFFLRYAQAGYTFAYHAQSWHCIKAWKVDSSQAVICRLPSTLRVSYDYASIPLSMARSLNLETSPSASSWYSNWQASNNPLKNLTIRQVTDELCASPDIRLDIIEKLAWRDPVYRPIWDDMNSCIPRQKFMGFIPVTYTTANATDYNILCPKPKATDLLAVKVYAESFFKMMSDEYAPSRDVHSQCAQDLADCGVATDVNSIALIGDLMNCKEEISRLTEGLLQLAKGVVSRNPIKLAKAVSSLFLSFQYGARLTLSDLIETVSAVKTVLTDPQSGVVNGYRVARTRYTQAAPCSCPPAMPGGRLLVYKMYYKAYPMHLTSAIQELLEWDLWPTLDNLWDLVPFSFVVNWFVSVDKLCKQIDDQFYLSSLDIGGVVWSTKDVYTLPTSVPGTECTILAGRVTCYRRRLQATPKYILPSISLSGRYNQNYLEGSALIVQHR